MANGIIWTTTNSIDGCHVEKYLGVISREIVFRNGLFSAIGAKVTNLVNSFNFRDVELKGSTELISNAKRYLMDEFEKEAQRRGANAILGIDFETSFGAELIKVSINGTSVRIVGDISASVENDYEENDEIKINVSQSNVVDEFIITKIKLYPAYSPKTVSINIVRTETYDVDDLICDVVLHTRFGEKHILKDIYCLNFEKGKKIASCESYPVSIPFSVYRTIDSVAVIVKKVNCGGKITEYQNSELSDVKQFVATKDLETENRQVSLIDYYKGIGDYSTKDDLILYIKNAAGILDSEEYVGYEGEAIEKIKNENDNSGSFRMVKAVQKAFIHALNSTGGLVPEPLENGVAKCPVCGRTQDNSRRVCLSCGVILKSPEN